MEVGVAEPGRFERLSAGTEDERDAALLERPDERVFRRVVRAGIGQREEVVLHPELCLLPGGLLGLGDQLVLAGDFHVGDPLRERRGLAIDGHQLPLHLGNALAQPVLEVLLVRLLHEEPGLLVD